MIAAPAAFVRKTLALLSGQRLPACVLSREPLVVAAFWEDFVKAQGPLLAAVAAAPHALFAFQFGWHKTAADLQQIARSAREVTAAHPGLSLLFLANTAEDEAALTGLGVAALHCNHNALLDEKRYPLHDLEPTADAIYVARIAPFKRHELAAQIPSLELVGAYTGPDAGYFARVRTLMPDARWRRRVRGPFMSKAMARARVGLCLSAEEGAMFVSAEYLLSGRPVVSTRSLGGRDVLFDPETCLIVDDDPAAVAAGVREMASRRLAPAFVRAKVLAKMAPHRQRFLAAVQAHFDRVGAGQAARWERLFLHKLGLRCGLGPVAIFTRSLLREVARPTRP